MERLDRRRFLRQAAFGSGAVPILGAAGILNAQPSPQPNANVNVQPVHGRILTISGTTLALEAAEGLRPLSVGGARIWKGAGARVEHLRPGDVVWGRGVPMPDGLLVVTDLWVNIVNVSGRIDTIVSSTTFVMQWGPFGLDQNPVRKTRVRMDAQTVVNDGSLAARERLVTGRAVQVVGIASDESTVRASRVFV